MRITESKLRRIIREALGSWESLLTEAFWERYDRLGAACRSPAGSKPAACCG